MLIRAFLLFFFCLLSTSAAAANPYQVVAGAGPSTRVVKLFFEEFSKQPAAESYTFSVPLKSVKHKGGVKNSDRFLFGRTGRPLNGAEQALNKGEIYLAMVPIVIVAGDGALAPSLSMRELEMIYRKQITNWKKVDGPDAPIVTVGRERTEALFTELRRYYYFFLKVSFDKTFHTDHEVVSFLRSSEGRYAIAFGAAPNFTGMNILPINERLQTGVRVGLVYDLKNGDHALVKAVQDFAVSEDWRQVVKKSRLGLYPVESGATKVSAH